MQFAELLAVEKHKQTVDFTTDSGRDHNQSYFFVPKFSVLDQGTGRPFLLTKYCGRIFSARSGPVFGRGLSTAKVSSEGAPGNVARTRRTSGRMEISRSA